MAQKSKVKLKTPQGRAEELGRRLSDAICGWLTFQQAARRHRAYNEHLTYLPVFEVADGRKWQVYPQFRVKNDEGAWRSTIDFLFYHEVYGVFVLLEIKFQKFRGAPIKPFTPDVQKMLRADHALIEEQAVFEKVSKPRSPIYRLMMSVAQGNDLKRLWRDERENPALRAQARSIFTDSETEGGLTQTNNEGGCLRISPAKVGRDFRVLTLYERDWWVKELPKNSPKKK